MILVRNLRLSPDEDISLLPARAAEKLRIPASQIERCILKKRSLDARKKDRIHYICTVSVSISGSEDRLLCR